MSKLSLIKIRLQDALHAISEAEKDKSLFGELEDNVSKDIIANSREKAAEAILNVYYEIGRNAPINDVLQ